jgi:hypothetical protein
LEKENIEINVGDIFRYSNIKYLAKNIIQPRIKNNKNMNIKDKQETLLIDNIPGEEKEKILNRLQYSIKAFNEAILKENVFKCCPLSAMQKSHLKLSNRSSGGIMALNGYPEQEKLHDSIIKVIKSQGLLRSRLVKEGETLLWYQHEMPEDLNLPFIDLSGYTIEIQDGLTHMIVSRYFPNRGIDVTILPYSIILIKKNEEDYLLIFSADHTVYDAMSNQVVRSDIHSFYYGKEEETDTARLNGRNYEEYVKQINKGPQHVEEEKIIEIFQLNDFKDSIARVKRMFKEYRSDRYVTHEININYKDIFTSSPPGENLSLEISLNIYALLCRALFRIHKVPLLFFSLGRKYEDKSFFNTVGEFIDLVPILVDTDSDIPNITGKIEEKIAFASTHNINFMTTVMNKEVSKKWNRVTRMLSPNGVDYDKNLLRFNFIGKTDNIPLEKEIVKNEDPGESTKRFDVELEGATFWSSFNKDVLKMAVGINMEIDPREFCEKLNFIAQQVINKYKE